MRKSLSLALLFALALSACGRTNPFGGDGFTPPDGFGPPADFTSDGGPPPGDFGPPPPPPPGDFGPPPPPPPGDFGPPPPPPFDFGPPPPPPFDFGPPPPPPDFGPPPPPPPTDGGPCVSGCAQRCALINQCGFVPPAACSALCPGFNAATRACLDVLVCNPTPFPNCSAIAQCFTSPPPPPPPFDGGPPPPPPFDGGPPPPPPFDGGPPPPPPFDGGPPPPPPFRPDLVVQSFTASVSGSTVRYDLRVCNVGGSPATNFFVDVYYNRPSPPPTNDFGDDFQRFNRLSPGACVSATFTRSNTPPGGYTSWAQVDADGNVNESNEGNNIPPPLKVVVGGPPPPPIGPDLTIQSMTANVSGSGTTVSYRIRVCNQGSVTSAPTQVHVYYDRASAPPAGQSGDKLTSVPSLAAGGCTDRLIARTGTPPGSYRSYAQVDPLNVVVEQNESNNTFGPVPVTVGSTPGADLTIQSFTAQVLGTAGTTVRYRIRVCNSGSGTSGATNVHVYYNRTSAPSGGAAGDQLTTVGQLAPGACSTRFITRSGTPPGSYASWAQVDVPSIVSETDENNNTAGPLSVTVGGPQNVDLIVAGFNAQAAGTTVSYNALVCNVGAQSSGSTRFDLYFNRTTPPQPFNAGDRSQLIPSLAAGQCFPLAIARSNTPSGSYTSWARVDRFNQVAESNENNNVAGPTSVTVGSTTTSCSSICQRLAGPPCNLLPANQLPQCIIACSSLPDSARVCASNALANGQCFAAIQCILPVPGPIPLP